MSLDPISAVPPTTRTPCTGSCATTHPVYYSAERDLWYLSRYADVHDAINNAAVFSSAQGVVPSGFVSDTPVLITMDPPDHTELRKAVQRAFTPKQIAEMEQHIRNVAGQLLDALPASGEVDAVTLFTDQLPLLVMTELLGVDLADRAMFKRCGDIIVSQTRRRRRWRLRRWSSPSTSRACSRQAPRRAARRLHHQAGVAHRERRHAVRRRSARAVLPPARRRHRDHDRRAGHRPWCCSTATATPATSCSRHP